MNCIEASVKRVRSVDKLHVVSFDYHGVELTMMSLALDASVKEGVKVALGFKSSAVGIVKAFVGELSYSNKVQGFVSSIEQGELLSVLHLKSYDTEIESLITTQSLLRMGVCEGDDVQALIKASDIYIIKVLQ